MPKALCRQRPFYHRRAGLLGALMAAIALLPLGGCGFRPLYAVDSYDSHVMSDLASVHVSPLPERQGQLLHNALLTDLNPLGEPEHPHYRLEVTTKVTENQQALRTDDTATRDVLYYNVTYWLYEDKTRITVGTFNMVFSYDFLQEHYANISTADDIQHRAANAIAEEIRNRLAAYFAKAAEVKAASGGKQ